MGFVTLRAEESAPEAVARIRDRHLMEACAELGLQQCSTESRLHYFIDHSREEVSEGMRAGIVARWRQGRQLLAGLSPQERRDLRALWRARAAVERAEFTLWQAQRRVEPLRRLDPADQELLSVELLAPQPTSNTQPATEAP